MKTATIPSLRVDPDLRKAAEDVLRDGETLSGLVETALRAQIEQRRAQDAFAARGLASRDKSRRSGVYVASDTLIGRLEAKLVKSKKSSR